VCETLRFWCTKKRPVLKNKRARTRARPGPSASRLIRTCAGNKAVCPAPVRFSPRVPRCATDVVHEQESRTTSRGSRGVSTSDWTRQPSLHGCARSQVGGLHQPE
jgi:hypothetical protein